MIKVLISDKLAPEAIDIFKEAGIEVDFKPGLNAEELGEIIGEYDGLAFRLGDPVTARLVEASPVSGGLILEIVEGGEVLPKKDRRVAASPRSSRRTGPGRGGKTGFRAPPRGAGKGKGAGPKKGRR